MRSKEPPEIAAPRKPSDEWQKKALVVLAQHLAFPAEAVRDGVQGTVQLALTITPDGRILSARLSKSSGSYILDNAAFDAVKTIDALPHLDNEADSETTVILPVAYRLAE